MCWWKQREEKHLDAGPWAREWGQLLEWKGKEMDSSTEPPERTSLPQHLDFYPSKIHFGVWSPSL